MYNREVSRWLTFGNGRSQGRLAVINMTNSSDVNVRLVSAERLFSLHCHVPSAQWDGTLQPNRKYKWIYDVYDTNRPTLPYQTANMIQAETYQLVGAVQETW